MLHFLTKLHVERIACHASSNAKEGQENPPRTLEQIK